MKWTYVAIACGVLIGTTQTTSAQQSKPKILGDHGYNHHLYHNEEGTGVIDRLNRQSLAAIRRSCCNGVDECRETEVNEAETQIYLDGRWCDIPAGAFKTWSIPLPDTHNHVVVCANKGTAQACPKVWCMALRPKGT